MFVTYDLKELISKNSSSFHRLRNVEKEKDDYKYSASRDIAKYYNELNVDDEVKDKLTQKSVHSKIAEKLEESLLKRIDYRNEELEKKLKSVDADKEEFNEDAKKCIVKYKETINKYTEKLNKLGVNSVATSILDY